MQSGSQATRGVADIVLTNDSFAVLPHAITEGQRIIAGMQSVLKLFLTRTFFLALLIIAVVWLARSPSRRARALLSFLTAGIPAVALAAWARPARAQRGGALGRIASFAVPASLAVTLIGLLLFVVYCVPVFQVARGSVTVDEINAMLKETLPRAQTVDLLPYGVRAALGDVRGAAEPILGWQRRTERRPPPDVAGDRPAARTAGDRGRATPVWDIRSASGQALDVVVIAAAAAVWVFLVRWAWRRSLLERFLGIDLDR